MRRIAAVSLAVAGLAVGGCDSDDDGQSVITKIERVSKPGCRVYRKADDVERVLRGLGVGIYSTPKGMLTDAQCREQKLGGEYVGRVW